MRRNSNYLVAMVLLLIVGLSVGYASISSTLTINGTSSINKTTWDVHFQNVSVTKGSVSATTGPSISSDGLSIDYSVPLSLPGNFFEFTVEVINNGSISAKLSDNPIIAGVSVEQDVYTNYLVTYSDGTEIKSGDILNSGDIKIIKVRIEYDRNITASQLPSESQTLNLIYSMNYVQK